MNAPQKKDELPEQIPPALARAELFRQKGELGEAMAALTPYLNDHFDSVPALMLAAHIFMDDGRIGMAHPLLKRASQIEPNNPMIWNNIGTCYREGANWDEAETLYYRALKLSPNDALTNANIASLYVARAQPHQALKHLKIAMASNPGIAEAYYNRALANVSLGNYKEGWADYDNVLGQGDTRKERVYGMIPRWNGKEGKSLIAYGEQGIGDEIAFASCIPDLAKQNKVILECDPRLWGLFKRSFDLETHGTRFDERIPWLHDKETKKLRKIDGAVAFGSLPQYYRNELSAFPGTPYLVADPERRIQWRALLDALGPKMKVGITWTGGNPNTGKARRSLELEELLPILRQDATFISLQYQDAPEVLALQRDHGIKIHHWKRATQSNDYDDTASLVAELDLVISVTTAVIHLSGALGQKCWVMAPKHARWFYGVTGETMPWYQSVKLYRQKAEWVHTIAQIATDLRNTVQPPIEVLR